MFRCAFFIGILLQVCILFGDFKKVEDQSSLRILSPDFKDYQVVKGILNNQLKVLIISDPKAIESAAALSVEVGSWEDPKQYPGMAHFVEHMLFLGTKKFPEENQYAHFINEHGGNQNAYTSQDHTVYIYSIDNAYFQQSLERFADFFIQPIFSKSGLERERLAVHSEHMRNLENDAYRFYYLTKTLTDKSHPYSQFSTGSKFTLQDVGTKELFNWFNQYYSSQIMQLVVYSSQSVDMLIDWVEKNFSNIPNSLVKYPEYTGRMIKKNQQPTVVYLDPVKDQQTLRLRWAIPAKFTSEKQRFIVDTASFILGHEGEGSLLSTLKKAKLAESIGVGSYIYREEGVLEMYLRLTTQGLEHVDAVIERIYQAIERLKQEAVPDYLPQEIYQMNLDFHLINIWRYEIQV